MSFANYSKVRFLFSSIILLMSTILLNFHVDAYRLTQASSFDDLMIWDSAVSPWNVIVEWPEKVASRLPRSLWKLKATILADGGHKFTLSVN